MAKPTAPTQLKEWLSGLGLEKYVDLFAAQEIEFSVLPELTDADLQNLSIPLGSRKRLLKAIGQLKQDDSAVISPTRRRVDQPERRQMTVMFCDLVGSTALSRRLDPEDMRGVLRAYQDLVARQVTRFDGHIAGFAGDSVKVYFGFPSASENSA